RPPGRLSRAREARPHPRGAAQGLPPGRPGRAGARAGGEDAAAAGRTARSARPAPPRALPAPAARAPEPGPAARALLRDRCRPSGRQACEKARELLSSSSAAPSTPATNYPSHLVIILTTLLSSFPLASVPESHCTAHSYEHRLLVPATPADLKDVEVSLSFGPKASSGP
ncbi:hypothetical protein LEMLEM_LOCUS10763, partial [Lemmus lemmus]